MATYGSNGGWWAGFDTVGWQPKCLMVVGGPAFGLSVGNLRVLWWFLGRVWGCRLATYRSYGGCWVWGCRLATCGFHGGSYRPALGL